MKKSFMLVTILALLVMLAPGCAPEAAPAPTPPAPAPAPTPEEAAPPPPPPTPKPTPAPEPAPSPMPEANFRLLISDDVNAIDHFKSLFITITRVGVQKGGESGKWHEFPPATEKLDLVPLQEDNAQEIWSGNLTAGRYTKVFIYVDNVTGIFNTGNSTEVKLPSDKLHINTHFTIPDDAPVNFVFDLTVVAAGSPKSGIKYILKPVVSQSGPNQKFIEVRPPEKKEKPEGKLDLELEGDAVPGETVTLLVTVTFEGKTVEGAQVKVNGEDMGQTDEYGTISFTIPDDADELKIEAKLDELEGELEKEFEGE